jgi:hypothetical protein
MAGIPRFSSISNLKNNGPYGIVSLLPDEGGHLKNLPDKIKKDLTDDEENDIIIFVERTISSAGRAPDS